MSVKQRNGYRQTHRLLWWACFAWGVFQAVYYGWIFMERPEKLPEIVPMWAYYATILVAMAYVRHRARKAHKALPRRRGGFFVVGWMCYAGALYLASAYTGHLVPSGVFTTFLVVLGVFLGTRLEKHLFQKLIERGAEGNAAHEGAKQHAA